MEKKTKTAGPTIMMGIGNYNDKKTKKKKLLKRKADHNGNTIASRVSRTKSIFKNVLVVIQERHNHNREYLSYEVLIMSQ